MISNPNLQEITPRTYASCIIVQAGKMLVFDQKISSNESNNAVAPCLCIETGIPTDGIDTLALSHSIMGAVSLFLSLPEGAEIERGEVISDPNGHLGQTEIFIVAVPPGELISKHPSAFGTTLVPIASLEVNIESFQGWSRIVAENIKSVLPRTSYLFDCGDTVTGSVGFCARITAYTKVDALARLREIMPQEIPLRASLGKGEYFVLYTNGKSVTTDDIGDFEAEE